MGPRTKGGLASKAAGFVVSYPVLVLLAIAGLVGYLSWPHELGDGCVGRRCFHKQSNSAPVRQETSSYCSAHFGNDWLQSWHDSAEIDCLPKLDGLGARDASRVVCRRLYDDHMPATSAPHTLCDIEQLMIDPAKAVLAWCPKHRPGYLCASRTYHHYDPGSFTLQCSWSGGSFNESRYSRDHHRDLFEAMAAGMAGEHRQEESITVRRPTLLITREIHEHANLFHTLTDLLNAYITLRVLGWRDWGVLLMDDHPTASLDEIWGRLDLLGGSGRSIRNSLVHAEIPPAPRLSNLAAPTRFVRAAVPPPGYSSLLFAHLYEPNSCTENTELFRGFREFALSLFGIDARTHPGPQPGTPFKVVVISRRPSGKRRRLARQIENEEELVAALAGLPSVQVRAVDMAVLSLTQQLTLVQETDLLVGMHGAGLAHSILARPGTALLELWPEADGIWRCYEHFAEWAGLLYGRWANADPARHKQTSKGDSTIVDTEAVAALAARLLEKMAAQG